LRKKATTKLCSRYGKNNEKKGVKKKDRKNEVRRGRERDLYLEQLKVIFFSHLFRTVCNGKRHKTLS